MEKSDGKSNGNRCDEIAVEACDLDQLRAVRRLRTDVNPRDPRLAESIYRAMIRALGEAAGSGDAAICQALEMLAANRGQNSYRHAAAYVRGTVNGRPSINDSSALRRIVAFPPERQRDAIGIVAREVAGEGADQGRVAAIAHRLRRKLREKQMDKSIMSGDPDA